jgi:hypothetical protein
MKSSVEAQERATFLEGTMKSLVVAGALALMAAPAVAGPIGTGGQACADVFAAGSSVFQACADVDGKGDFRFALASPFRFGGDDGFVIDALSFSGNTDPFVDYSVSFTDAGAPTSLTVTFSTVIVPAAYTHATSSLAISLTGAQGSTVSLAPLAPATYIGSGAAAGTSFPMTSLGVDVGSACSGTGAVTCTPDSAESFFAPLTANLLVASAAFQLSGGGDRAILDGNVTIDTKARPVPEPTLTVLLGTALAALAARRHRRR